MSTFSHYAVLPHLHTSNLQVRRVIILQNIIKLKLCINNRVKDVHIQNKNYEVYEVLKRQDLYLKEVNMLLKQKSQYNLPL